MGKWSEQSKTYRITGSVGATLGLEICDLKDITQIYSIKKKKNIGIEQALQYYMDDGDYNEIH